MKSFSSAPCFRLMIATEPRGESKERTQKINILKTMIYVQECAKHTHKSISMDSACFSESCDLMFLNPLELLSTT